MIGYIFKMDDTYYFVQAHEVQSILYNCGRYYSSYFLRVLISLGKVVNLLLVNLKQIDSKRHVWFSWEFLHFWDTESRNKITNYKDRLEKGFVTPQIANSQIFGLIPQSQIRKFMRCTSPQIAKPQICND